MSLRKPNGLTWEFHPEGKIIEGETVACGHCTTMEHVHKNSEKEDIGWGVCYVCYRIVCGPCYAKGKCEPWEEYLAKKEAQYESRRSMGLIE